ncbi:MAG: tetratricopeptide repeat protein, partial [Chloroflexi bacterium]|nr:tetratricopeptide repeat protein [Chloroflexota bacterium]
MTTIERMLKLAIAAIAALLVVAVAGLGAYYYQERLAPRDPGTQLGAQTRDGEQQVRADPQNADLRASVATMYFEQGQYEQAVAQAEAALKLKPEHQGALLVVGQTRQATGQTDAAIEAYQTIVVLNKDNPTAKVNRNLELVYYSLGEIYARRGDPQAASENCRAALEIQPGDADASLGLGRAYEKLGEHSEAVTAFNAAVRYDPEFREAYEGLLACYQALNRAAGIAYARGMIAHSTRDDTTAVA